MNTKITRLDIDDNSVKEKFHANAVKIVAPEGKDLELYVLSQVTHSGAEIWDVRGKCSQLAAIQILTLLNKAIEEEP